MGIQEAKIWSPNLDIIRPIDEKKIEGFRKWVTYSTFGKGYRRGVEPYPRHLGLDFISYLDIDGEENFGLEKSTEVLAIGEGVVMAIHSPGQTEFYRRYQTYLVLQHNRNRLASGYCHINPTVRVGESVKKGQPIGTLYDSLEPGNWAVPTHLHFELGRIKTDGSNQEPISDKEDPLIALPRNRDLFVPKNSLV